MHLYSNSYLMEQIKATFEIESQTSDPMCLRFLRGTCRLGVRCRFSHQFKQTQDSIITSTVQSSRAKRRKGVYGREQKYVVKSGPLHLLPPSEPGSVNSLCPSEYPCKYGAQCLYSMHMKLCEICNKYCLHPTNQVQRQQHIRTCLKYQKQRQDAVTRLFLIERSKNKICGICLEVIVEKNPRDAYFGLLSNCNHVFCIKCIATWRQKTNVNFAKKKLCPECCISSEFVRRSNLWYEGTAEKRALFEGHKCRGYEMNPILMPTTNFRDEHTKQIIQNMRDSFFNILDLPNLRMDPAEKTTDTYTKLNQFTHSFVIFVQNLFATQYTQHTAT